MASHLAADVLQSSNNQFAAIALRYVTAAGAGCATAGEPAAVP